uniref:Uncharacterized protein n=1 Tax=Oryza punctata TaxID=4537 RepID=A0A0E0KUG1_ORYPU
MSFGVGHGLRRTRPPATSPDVPTWDVGRGWWDHLRRGLGARLLIPRKYHLIRGRNHLIPNKYHPILRNAMGLGVEVEVYTFIFNPRLAY